MYWGMDVNKIFGLFEQPEGNEKFVAKEEYDKLIENYKKHPLYWVGMFKKLVQNHQLFNDQLLKFFDNLNQKLLTILQKDFLF